MSTKPTKAKTRHPHAAGKGGLFTRWRRAVKDNRGLAALEFALLLPVIISIYFGTGEVTALLTVDRKVTKAASSVGDLVAQAQTLNDAEIADIFQATASILMPFPNTGLQVRITSVLADNNNLTTVGWSDGFNMSPLANGAPVSVPTGLTDPNTSVVMVEVAYTYTSVVGQFVTGGVTMNDTFYLRPRDTAAIVRN